MTVHFESLLRQGLTEVDGMLAVINAHEFAIAVALEYAGTAGEADAFRAIGAVGRQAFPLHDEFLQTSRALDSELLSNGPHVGEMQDRLRVLVTRLERLWLDYAADWTMPD